MRTSAAAHRAPEPHRQPAEALVELGRSWTSKATPSIPIRIASQSTEPSLVRYVTRALVDRLDRAPRYAGASSRKAGASMVTRAGYCNGADDRLAALAFAARLQQGSSFKRRPDVSVIAPEDRGQNAA
jgi:hypothetical protein